MPESSNKKPTNAFASTSTPLTTSKYSIMAVFSLSLSCLSLFIGPIGYIPGIIFGHAARSECKKNPQLLGSGMALAGLIVGYLCLVFTILLVVLIIKYVEVAFTSFKITDPDAIYRMLEELKRILSTVKT
jgi:ABC-type Fe3+-siderophore transport system permease subunit